MNNEAFIVDTIHQYLPQAKIYAFGSRVRKIAKKFSDFDISIDNQSTVDLRKLSAIHEAFDESNFPYKIDITDFHRVSTEFQKIILSTGKEL